MKKNLVLVHLESLNSINYEINKDLFISLKEIENKSMVFPNYYSTATSTLMVLSDLMYGGMEQYEKCKSLDDILNEYYYGESLFDELKKAGYATGAYTFPEGGDVKSADKRHVAGFDNKLLLIDDYDRYMREMEELMNNKCFAILACNVISNIAINYCIDTYNYPLDMTRWEIGYRYMDKCCHDLLHLIKQKNLMENTVIVFYGDHGDDYWGHGMHMGLTHAIEPNNMLIKTPLFIWNGDGKKKVDKRLIQTTDLKEVIEKLLGIKENVECKERKYIFSRNEYAMQPVREESFNKSYAVCDGNFLLLVSGEGLEMYDVKMDPACQNNLLAYFKLEDGYISEDLEVTGKYKYHFESFFDSRMRRIIKNTFYRLKSYLEDELLYIYGVGNKSKEELYAEMKLNKLVKL